MESVIESPSAHENEEEKNISSEFVMSVLLYNSLWVIKWMMAVITSRMQLIQDYDSVYKALFKLGKPNLKIIA